MGHRRICASSPGHSTSRQFPIPDWRSIVSWRRESFHRLGDRNSHHSGGPIDPAMSGQAGPRRRVNRRPVAGDVRAVRRPMDKPLLPFKPPERRSARPGSQAVPSTSATPGAAAASGVQADSPRRRVQASCGTSSSRIRLHRPGLPRNAVRYRLTKTPPPPDKKTKASGTNHGPRSPAAAAPAQRPANGAADLASPLRGLFPAAGKQQHKGKRQMGQRKQDEHRRPNALLPAQVPCDLPGKVSRPDDQEHLHERQVGGENHRREQQIAPIQ